MKISCQSCQAKYTIADEKVVGKVVKIRCKKCGSTIVINGAEGHAADDASAGGNDVYDYAAGAGDQWTVNVAEGDQRTMSTQDIVNEYRTGVVTTETYCWKDGMDGWLPLRDIDQLHRAVASPSVHPIATSTGGEFAPSAAPLFGAASGGGGGSLFGDNGGGAPAPAAARRDRTRNAGADLFGGAAQAGSENDRMVSAAAAAKEEPKLTGQRNESSVLFSLSALTKEGEKNGGGGGGGSSKPENKTTAQGDGSGLIDIRALSSANAKSDKPKSSGVDDIMNLGGGGAFGAALAAPILAPPAMDHGAVSAAEMEQSSGNKGNKGIIFAIIGGVGFLTIAVVLAIVFTRPPAVDPAANTGSGHTGATGPSALAQNDPPKDTATTAAAPPPSEPATTAKEPGAGTVAAATGPKAGTPTGGKKAEPSGGAATPAAPAAPPAAPVGTSLEAKMRAAAGQTAPPPAAPAAASGAAFDRGAAAASLGSINVASCKKPDGPTGSGHVNVTFEPSGSVSSAVVDGGPFPGTPVGGCIAGKFRGARVPAFGGSSVKVGKSFTL